MANSVMISTNRRSRYHIGSGENVLYNILLRFLYLFANVAGLSKQRFSLFPFSSTKISLVFMCHIAVLGCLLFQPFYFFGAVVCGYLAVERQLHLPLIHTGRITHTNYIQSFIGELFA